MPNAPELKRGLSFGLLTLYGLGTTIGAGIYALTGEVAGYAGMAAPWAFALACLLAALSALSFGEMSARFPRSAGEAVYVREGLGVRGLATCVGLLVALAGIVSAATLVNGFIGYFRELVLVPRSLGIAALVIVLGGIAAAGIRASVRLAGLITLIELGGLVAIIFVSRHGLAELPARWAELLPASADPGIWRGILAGALLAFYAFLGFEDMVNVAEEVKNARRTLPAAILATLAITALVYVLLAACAVLVVPPQELSESDAPLALLWRRSTGGGSAPIEIVAVLAMLNGVLIQLIMASRVMYGLSRQGSLPELLGRVHARTHTPVHATAVATLATLGLALFFPLAPLAAATSTITLVVFALVNLALWRLKRVSPTPPGLLSVPLWVPVGGCLVSVIFLALALTGLARS